MEGQCTQIHLYKKKVFLSFFKALTGWYQEVKGDGGGVVEEAKGAEVVGG